MNRTSNASLARQASCAFAEMLLLLLAGLGMALIGEGRYHPIFAGDPFRALSFWQRGLCLALFLGLLELALVVLGKGRPGLTFPIGVTEVRSWLEFKGKKIQSGDHPS